MKGLCPYSSIPEPCYRNERAQMSATRVHVHCSSLYIWDGASEHRKWPPLCSNNSLPLQRKVLNNSISKRKKCATASLYYLIPKSPPHKISTSYFKYASRALKSCASWMRDFFNLGRNVFSEQSKSEDRTQMTAKQNEELDNILHRFLGLVSGRLLLKPAMKAVEWLVRRFRVHDYNTECLLMAFLPYHTSHIFPTVLSIIPGQLPVHFRFLHPYISSLQSPPRHAILSATVGSPGLLTAFSQFVLKVTRAKNHSALLLGFWASITAQAVSGIIDTSRSGREEIRRQREEDLLLRVLPILQSALSIRDVPELYLGSCMIMTILASKATLDDRVLDAMIEAVSMAWDMSTAADGLTCLAVMAEEKHSVSQSKAVTRRIIELEQAADALEMISQRYRTDKLILATCLAVVDFPVMENHRDIKTLTTLLVDRVALSQPSLEYLIQSLFTRMKETPSDSPHAQAAALLEYLASRQDAARIVEEIGLQSGYDQQQLSQQFTIASYSATEDMVDHDAPAQALITESTMDKGSEIRNVLESLPVLDTDRQSLLDTGNDETFGHYANAFVKVVPYARHVQAFIDLLTSSDTVVSISLLTFLARFWCSNAPPAARAQAINLAGIEILKLKEKRSNSQFIFPYVLAALADDSRRVRKAAAELGQTQNFLLNSGADSKKSDKDARSWCGDDLYRSGIAPIQWLTTIDTQKSWNSITVLGLENCVLDGQHITRLLSEILNGSSTELKASNTVSKNLKISLRIAICTFLAGHVAATPVLQVKLHLLQALHGVGKPASEARKSALLLFVQQWVSIPSARVAEVCIEQHADVRTVDRAILGSLSHRSIEEIQSLKMIVKGELGSRTETRPVALTCLKSLWSAMKTPSQIALAEFLLELVLDANEDESGADEDLKSDALEILQDLQFSSDVLVHLVDNLPSTTDLQQEAPPNKKRRTSKSESLRPTLTDSTKLNHAVKKITTVLELVEIATAAEHPQLLTGLFRILDELHHFKQMLGSQLGYLQGLLMSCLLSVVSELKDITTTTIDRSVVRADLIVETVRTTTSTQVHNTALLLISALASLAPELVLHSVMPLFTFMSTTLLRQSDEYSAHVTDQTVARVIPPLAISLKKKGKDLVTGVSELLLSFTAAFEHIPSHRRAGLFQHLVQTLGPEETLFAVVAMLADRYSTDMRIIPFIKDLMNSFGALTQLKAFSQYMALLSDALKPKRALSDAILGFGEKDHEQIIRSVDNLLTILAELLKNPILRKRIAKELNNGGHEAEALRAIYANLLKQTMSFSPDAELKDAAGSVLDALLVLTLTKDFIESSTILMQNGSDHKTHQQVFRALEIRASEAKSSDPSLQIIYIDVLENCCFFIRSDQPVATRHAAITCVDQVVEKFGKTDPTRVVNAAQHIAGAAALGSEDMSLQVISVLCMATMVEILGDDFIPLLPQVLGQSLTYLESTLDDPSDFAHLDQAIFTFLETVLDNIPWMFDAANLDRALTFVVQSTSVADGFQGDATAAERFCTLASRKLGAAETFIAVDRVLPHAVKCGPAGAILLLNMLQKSVRYHTKTTIAKNTPLLFGLILNIFDIRRAGLGVRENESEQVVIGELEQLINAITLDVVLKLNDATFRPFFIRLVEWAISTLPASDHDGRLDRALSLYSFVQVLSEQLKSIVTSYASFVTEHAATLLINLKGASQKESQLSLQVLKTLTSLFQHDQDDFWQAPAHFESVAQPVTDQLRRAADLPITNAVIPAITELAVAVASPEHLKQLNMTIMSFMRSSDAAVRLAAVQTERAVTERLNFDWLALLPEMLPFISELQEDDDEDVERETLKWVEQIEGVTGESLGDMLR
nr:u3 small nucleolar rna-associated protein 10 [Quercus suber]